MKRDCFASLAMTVEPVLKPLRRRAKLFRHPVGDVVGDQRAVVGAAMLGAAVRQMEYLELAVGAVGRRRMELFGVPERNLAVVLAMHDQELAGDVGGALFH